MRRHISQNEAHALARRVEFMEIERNNQRRGWARDYPGGQSIGNIQRDRDWMAGRLEGAQRLGHAIVVTVNDSGCIEFYALPLPK